MYNQKNKNIILAKIVSPKIFEHILILYKIYIDFILNNDGGVIKLKIFRATNLGLVTLTSDESLIRQFANGIRELDNSIKSIFEFFGNLGRFFKETGYWLFNPGKLLDALQPWIIIILLIMIVLKLIGFDTSKWFKLCFLVFILSLIF